MEKEKKRCICGAEIEFVPPFGYIHANPAGKYICKCPDCGHVEAFLFYNTSSPRHCMKCGSPMELDHIAAAR